MKIRPQWLAWVATAVAGVATCAALMREREPEVDGKPLRYWLAQFSSYGDGNHDRAEISFRAFGTNAVEWLIPELLTRDSVLKRWLVCPTTQQSRIPIKFVPDLERRRRAVRACSAMGQNALGALSALEANLDGPDTDNNIGSALAAIGPEGIVPLTRAMFHSDSEISRGAGFWLVAKFKDQSDTVVPFLISKLQNGAPATRPLAAIALGTLREIPGLAVPALVEALTDPNPEVRVWSVVALGNFRYSAHSSLPILETLTNDPLPGIRAAATQAVMAILSPPPPEPDLPE